MAVSYTHLDFSALPGEIEKLSISSRRLCIVTDSNVEKLYLNEVKELLAPCCKTVISFVFPAGEEHKMCIRDSCYEEQPEFHRLSDEHTCACWLQHEYAPKVDIMKGLTEAQKQEEEENVAALPEEKRRGHHGKTN